MTTTSQWVAGARPRTLPAAIVPVAVGAAVAHFLTTPLSGFSFGLRTALALVVALALQIGVNYANDYSDGVRGTDDVRVGPVRLVGQGLAPAAAVKRAALSSFATAAIAGGVLVVLTQAWWLLVVGVLAIAAGWLYTGGPRPYGYAGLGEVFVFVFFGVVAVTGTTFVLTGQIDILAVALSCAVGLLACALLVTNNLRDIPGDTVAGKLTLAVRLGDRRTRQLYDACLLLPFAIAGLVGLAGLRVASWPVGSLLALVALPLCVVPMRIVHAGAKGPNLIPVLGWTGRVQLAFGALLTIGILAS